MKLTTAQKELWEVANRELEKIGGPGRIARNPDAKVRNAAKTEGTREWALLEATRLSSPANDNIMTDGFCKNLIEIIKATV